MARHAFGGAFLSCVCLGVLFSTNAPQQFLDESCAPVNCTAPGCTDTCQCKKPYHLRPFGKEITCSNRGITVVTSSFIESLPRHTVDLYLDENSIENTSNETFQSLPMLEFLSLNKNKFNKVKRESFQGLKMLKYLLLGWNAIETIETEAFAHLKRLRIIFLNNNKLRTFEKGTFWGPEKLLILDVNSNKIEGEVLESEAFQDLGRLKKLNLVNNQLVKIKKESFRSLRNLTSLDVRFNRIQSIEDAVFAEGHFIQELFLSNNRLKWIKKGSLQGLKIISTLDLRSNEIETIDREAFKDHFYLNTLYLTSNRLRVIQEGTFQSLGNLENLYLGNNFLREIKQGVFQGLGNLKTLSLAYNGIQQTNVTDFSDLVSLETLYMDSNNIRELKRGAFQAINKLRLLTITQNNMQTIAAEAFGNLGLLTELNLMQNRLQNLKSGTFRGLYQLITLTLSSNKMESIEDGCFLDLISLQRLELGFNNLRRITSRTFSGHLTLNFLDLQFNKIETIEDEAFKDCRSLESLHLKSNLLRRIDKRTFHGTMRLDLLDLGWNKIEYIADEGFSQLRFLRSLDIKENKLERITRKTFAGLYSLQMQLWLRLNFISHIQVGAFQHFPYLEQLLIEKNKLQILRRGLFDGLTRLQLLDLSFNEIMYIEDKTFKDLTQIVYLGLSRNKLKDLKPSHLLGLRSVVYIDLARNPIRYIDRESFKETPSLKHANFLGSSLDYISAMSPWSPDNMTLIVLPTDERLILTGMQPSTSMAFILFGVGIICGNVDTEKQQSQFVVFDQKVECKMCPTGTHTTFPDCTDCPPGGFYQDVMGFTEDSDDDSSVVTGCKLCPPGTYVHPDAAPGRDISECSSCPQGTQYDRLALFRACSCLEDFYRLDRFGPCIQCPATGFTCQNESVNLKPGFYWKWTSNETRQHYEDFSISLQDKGDYYDRKYVKFDASLPKAYSCPMARSCLGGMESSCSKGYEGPLCAVCSKGYYSMIASCELCPTVQWLIGQIALAAVVLLLVMLPLIFGKKVRCRSGRSVTDIVLARLKIFLGFYQVASGTFNAYSYVEWPKLVLELATYAKFLQLNLLQIAPLNCFTDKINVSMYTSFIVSLVTIAITLVVSVVYYNARKVYITKINSTDTNDIKNMMSSTKEFCFRYAFLLLFVFYPTVSAQVLELLPPSCQKICVDTKQKSCKSYLRSDYNLECFTDTYNKFSVLAFTMLCFVVGFPVVTLFLMWKYGHKDAQHNDDEVSEVANGLSFLYENYSESCWFWEVLELVRKILLSSVLVLIGGERRTSLGVAAIMSGGYAVLFAYYQPISDPFEHWLQLMSLLATCANMNVGILLKIPEDATFSGINAEAESVGISVVLISVNVLVTGMIAVRYIVAFFTVIKALRRRPQCNMECCVSVMMMMNDASEDVVMYEQESGDQESEDAITRERAASIINLKWTSLPNQGNNQ